MDDGVWAPISESGMNLTDQLRILEERVHEQRQQILAQKKTIDCFQNDPTLSRLEEEIFARIEALAEAAGIQMSNIDANTQAKEKLITQKLLNDETQLKNLIGSLCDQVSAVATCIGGQPL
eukprot:Filipodium_phascolosomae@DN7629_c0_g1_i1.p1